MNGTKLPQVIGLLLLLAVPLHVWAVGLTPAQYDVLRNDILVTNQAEMAADVAAKNWASLAAKYNALASPAFWVWRSSMPEKEIYEAVSPDSSTWNWTTFLQQSVQERDAWNTMMHPGIVNPSLSQTRAAFTKIFSGQGAPAAQQAFLLSLSRRQALRGEALLIIQGSGNGSTATPANLGYEGLISSLDVAHAIDNVPLP